MGIIVNNREDGESSLTLLNDSDELVTDFILSENKKELCISSSDCFNYIIFDKQKTEEIIEKLTFLKNLMV